MKELDIKDIWQTQHLSTPELKEEELNNIIKHRSQGIVEKLKKITHAEHICNIIITVVMLVFFLLRGEFIVTGLLFLLMIGVITYYRNLFRKLQSIQPTSDVKVYLVKVHKELKEFIRKYKFGFYVILTLIFGVSLFLAGKDNPGIEEKLRDPVFYIKVISLLAGILAVAFLLIHQLYGKKAQRIQDMIDELEK